MYADDHEIYEVGRDLANVKSSLSRNAEKASKWYEDNMLKGNYSKYKIMAMQNKGEITNPTMSIQGSEIEPTKKLNLFGVRIDSKLDFNHHINNVCKKASQRIGVLMRLKNLIPTEAKLQLYEAAIRDFKIHYGEMLLRLLWPRRTRLTMVFYPPVSND